MSAPPGVGNAVAIRLAPTVLLAFAIMVAAMSWNLGLGNLSRPGPGLWPFVVSVVMACASLALLSDASHLHQEPFTRRSLLVAVGAISLAAYIVAFSTLGYLLPTAALLLTWLRVLANESWAMAVPLTLGLTAACYVLFVPIMAVPFPDGVLPIP